MLWTDERMRDELNGCEQTADQVQVMCDMRAEYEAALDRHAEKANKVDEAMKRKDARIAELESQVERLEITLEVSSAKGANEMGEHGKYIAALESRIDEYAVRIAELEAEVKFLRGWLGGKLVVFGSEIDDKFAEWKQKQNAV